MPTVLEKTKKIVAFSKFAAAIEAACLESEIASAGRITLFAPTDDAFNQIPQWAVDQLFKPESRDQLIDTIRYHVAPGLLGTEDVYEMSRVETLQGQSITVDFNNGLRLDGARILKGDIVCDDGIIHVIDRVIPPQ